ncbi:MAG: 2-oxo acid dehydrogenase subunit E2 [Thermodesulfobacteriota bacterium]
MAFEVTMPKWGLTMKEGKITKWFKKEGDQVQKGEPFFEVETEKITNQVEATVSGVLFQIVVPAGTTVAVGTVVAVIAEPGEQPARLAGPKAGAPAAPAAEPRKAAAAEAPAEKKFVQASPAARRLAKELSLEISLVPGTGPDGRITEADVKKYHEQGPPKPKITPLAEELARQAGLDISGIQGTGDGGKITKEDVERAMAAGKEETPAEIKPGRVTVKPYAGLRRSIAANMYNSLHNTAQLSVFTEVDATEATRWLEAVRQEYKKDESVRVSLNDIVILAAARALKRFPIMNSNLVGEEILIFDDVNMGVAVALAEGLIVPVLKQADRKGLLQIAREARILAQKAREGRLEVDDVTGGTFTITNVSMFQVDGFTPVLKPPETGILGVGRVKEKPAAHQGQIVVRSLMFLSLTFDHQVVDGAPANEFLQTVARYIENPCLIMS